MGFPICDIQIEILIHFKDMLKTVQDILLTVICFDLAFVLTAACCVVAGILFTSKGSEVGI